MFIRQLSAIGMRVTVLAAMLISFDGSLFAQERTGDDAHKLETIEVTGTRIKKAEVAGQVPVVTITAKDIEETGLGSIGDVIQRLSVSGSSLNTKFNSAGNFGFPADGGGVGSGSTTISLRNLNAKRTLVLVDGLRWVSESSASGVSAAVDLNTIPSSIVERIEILPDGASSLYGSDAIAGVINIVTKKYDDGVSVNLYYGDYSLSGGKTTSGNVSFGKKTDTWQFFADISHYNQDAISSSVWGQSSSPVPGTGLANASSATPTTRYLFDTPGGTDFGGLCAGGFCNITANGIAPSGGLQSFPGGFHQFKTADRFNFAPYNELLTPSERTSFFMQGSYNVTDNVQWYAKGLYNQRDSINQAGPEPVFLGQQFCAAVDRCYGVGVDVTNPYNPFGFSLDGTSPDFGLGRRMVEGGPRIFHQSVDTQYYNTGLKGHFDALDRGFDWDVNYIYATNKASQSVEGTYNILHIQQALGPLSDCLSISGCVPLNLFGGPGTITPAMLKWVLLNEVDHSEQKLQTWTANISGDLVQLPAGELDFAAGYEHRKQSGYYLPDPRITAGESNGVPSGPTSGAYDVDEYYLELNAPLLTDAAFAKHLDLSLATRYSDYSTFGGTTNNKFGLRWQVVDDLTLRGTYSEGFRAPSIGELYGSFSRFDASLVDPCLAQIGGSGALSPATGNAANCAKLGVPSGLAQNNPQISVITGGNAALLPETSKSYSTGAVYSPSWAENTAWSQKVDLELTYWNYKIDNAIQAPNAQTQLNRCVDTLDPLSCDGITRAANGNINGFNNTLRNLGEVKTDGVDLNTSWFGPDSDFGKFSARMQLTYTNKYQAVATDTGAAEPQGVGREVADSGIPRIRATANLGWSLHDWTLGWTARYMSQLKEDCAGAAGFPICRENVNDAGSNVAPTRPNGTNTLGAVTYHDLRVTWKTPLTTPLTFAAGVNNIFAKDPPVCLSCSLNGYDASNYDLPGRYWYVEAKLKF